MRFFMAIHPPTVTAQEKRVSVHNGKPVFYDSFEIKEAREVFLANLKHFAPKKPMSGAISLTTVWCFPKGKHAHGEWKTTKPDTDNAVKLLKDCMTACGFWHDDAQVASETIQKRWSDEPCGILVGVEEL